MGIIYSDIVNILTYSHLLPVNSHVATFGRLEMFLNKADISRLRRMHGKNCPLGRYLESYRYGEYAERFFAEVLNVSHVQSIDMSDYEGATLLCDLSQPLPASLQGQYDLVWDGGTLEHVFNVPVAMGNLMSLAKPGGLVYVNLPCNNLCGHGFYQFSPELLYRTLSIENGFEMVLNRIGIAHSPSIEKTSGHLIYDVVDPDQVRQRVGLLSSRPVYMMALARRVEAVALFSKPVMQSDYARTWRRDRSSSVTASSGAGAPKAPMGLFKRILTSVVQAMREMREARQYKRHFSTANSAFYRRVR